MAFKIYNTSTLTEVDLSLVIDGGFNGQWHKNTKNQI